MEIRVEWDDMAREYVAEVVDYEGRGPTGTGDTKAVALFELVQLLKPTDKARVFAIDDYCTEMKWLERARLYNSLVSLGKLHDESNAEAAYAMRKFEDGFQCAVELLA